MTQTRSIARRALVGLGAVGAFVLTTFAPTDAAAQGKGRVISIEEITIVGRIQKPIASVDVNKIPPKLTLAELRLPFFSRIEEAIYQDPF